jgi:hypothetical protein
MNRLQDQVQALQLLRLEADLAGRMDTLFRRCPVLCGFSVQQGSSVNRERAVAHLEGDLFLADLASNIPLDGDQAAELCEVIADALLELMDEEPEAVELLPGRTFARCVH